MAISVEIEGIGTKNAGIGTQAVYPVKVAAAIMGITDGRVYQLIAEAEGKPDFLLPKDGQYLRTASWEELMSAGINPSIIRKPRHWITASEIERFRRVKRR
jgi:hypothetical protein